MVKFIADSSCDILTIPDVDFTAVPLVIHTKDHHWTDDADIDISDMLDTLASYKGRSYTSCPDVKSWLDAYEGGDVIYVGAMTSTLSGTYNAAMTAASIYQSSHPDAKIRVFDTLSTGPELRLLMEKLVELHQSGLDFEAVCEAADAYMKKTRVFFSLHSMHNLAQNGRVHKTIAAAIGLLGIRVVATASAKGDIEPVAKCRGDKKALKEFVRQLGVLGFSNSKIRISHIENPELANALCEQVRAAYPQADILVYPGRGLCSYYGERGAIFMGLDVE